MELLQGASDPLVSRAEGADFCAATGARMRVLEGVGHCIPEEAPKEVAAWLAALESGMAAGAVVTGAACNGSERTLTTWQPFARRGGCATRIP